MNVYMLFSVALQCLYSTVQHLKSVISYFASHTCFMCARTPFCFQNNTTVVILYVTSNEQPGAESSSASNGNNGMDGSNASGGDGSCNVVIGGAGGNVGNNNGNVANDDGTSGNGGLTIQSLECQSVASRNILA